MLLTKDAEDDNENRTGTAGGKDHAEGQAARGVRHRVWICVKRGASRVIRPRISQSFVKLCLIVSAPKKDPGTLWP